MWFCSTCDVYNSDGLDPCRCGQARPAGKADSSAKVKLAADTTRKLRKPRQRATGRKKLYCVVCGEQAYADDCIWRKNTEYLHHECFREVVYEADS